MTKKNRDKKPYLTQAQISRTYKVSRPTAGKWVEDAIHKNNNLQLVKVNNRYFALNNEFNQVELTILKERGVVYRNKIGYEKISPKPALNSIFSQSQIIELITSLEDHKQIPNKFAYFDQGAKAWDSYVNYFFDEPGGSYIKDEIDLIQANLCYIILTLQNYEAINLIEIGTGNGCVSKSVLNRLLTMNKPVRYTGIDISPSILEILKVNLDQWFPELEKHFLVGDIDYMVIRDILFARKTEQENTCNLILFNDTIGNVPDRHRVLKNLADSMSRGDYLWINNGLESQKEHKSAASNFPLLEEVCQWLIETIGFRPDLFTFEERFDNQTRTRRNVIVLGKDLDLEFQILNQSKTLRFLQGEEITYWEYTPSILDSFMAELKGAGFFITHLACHPDKSDVFFLCEVLPMLIHRYQD